MFEVILDLFVWHKDCLELLWYEGKYVNDPQMQCKFLVSTITSLIIIMAVYTCNKSQNRYLFLG